MGKKSSTKKPETESDASLNKDEFKNGLIKALKEQKKYAYTELKKIRMFKDKYTLEKEMEGLTPDQKIEFLHKWEQYIEKFKNEILYPDVKNYVTKKLRELEFTSSMISPNQTANKEPTYTSLKEIFVSEDAYNNIMKLLSKEEMTDKDTGLWIDKADGHKGRIVALLNDLFFKRYYNTDQMPMPETLMNIAKNTFGVEISKRMFHNKKIPAIRKEYFYFIPKHTTD